MTRASIARNPLHPILNDIPSAMTPASLAFDVVGAATGNRRLHDAARYALVGALIGGLPAAMAGVADYTELPEGSHEKRMATIHGAMNGGLLALVGLDLWLHRDGRSGAAPILLGALINGGMLASGWLGTRLVYGDGVAVAGHGEPAAVLDGAGI